MAAVNFNGVFDSKSSNRIEDQKLSVDEIKEKISSIDAIQIELIGSESCA